MVEVKELLKDKKVASSNLEETVDIEDRVNLRSAQESFHDTYKEQFYKKGYTLERGEGWFGDEPIILARAKYRKSMFRRYALLGKPRAQRKLQRLIPDTYNYDGKEYAVSFSVQTPERYRPLADLLDKYIRNTE